MDGWAIMVVLQNAKFHFHIMSYRTLKYTEFVEFGLKFFPVTYQKAILENNFNTKGIRSKPGM